MFDSGPSRSSSFDHPNSTPLYHPKPVPFTRPTLFSSYSSPACSISSSQSASPPSPSAHPMSSSSASCSPSPSSPPSPHLKPSHTLSAKHRTSSKLPKKTSSTTTNKVKSVQVSLEVKVERSRGFHAFFVPLARSMPPAPPSSPVFGQSANVDTHHGHNHHGTSDGGAKAPSEERWVEDVGHQMDVDA